MKEISQLIESKIHEERSIALILMTNQYKSGSIEKQRDIYELYVKQIKWINNWDLVDISAPGVVGKHLLDKMLNA